MEGRADGLRQVEVAHGVCEGRGRPWKVREKVSDGRRSFFSVAMRTGQVRHVEVR